MRRPDSVFDGFGNGVVTTRMERLAAADAPDGEPGAPDGSVPLERIARVIRAARIEPAIVAEHRPHQILVAAHARQQQRLHDGAPSSLSSSRRDSATASAMSAAATRWRTRRMMS